MYYIVIPLFEQRRVCVRIRISDPSASQGKGGCKMSPHGRKMLAPVIITIIFLLYLLIYVVMLAQVVLSEPLALILAIPLVLLGVGMVYVLFARIREIRSGEEDDLDNY